MFTLVLPRACLNLFAHVGVMSSLTLYVMYLVIIFVRIGTTCHVLLAPDLFVCSGRWSALFQFGTVMCSHCS